MEYRTGIGYDIHPLVEGRKLFLGGIAIPYVRGLTGHSDGDVLLHAVCDALLGAASGGDIGELFPDSDPAYAGVSSSKLLEIVAEKIKKDFAISNIDTIVVAAEPALASFKKKIQANIARILELAEDAVSIKAKSNNGLGDTGRKEAIAAYAVATLVRRD